MKRWLLVLSAVVGTASCHDPYSNDDLQFMYDSVPRDVEIVVPTEDGTTGVGVAAPPADAETARFYADTRLAADQINRDVLTLLGWIDEITALPPSQRMEDGRVWGPFPGEDGQRLTLIANRVRTSTVFQPTSTSTRAAVHTVFEYAMLGATTTQPEPRMLFSGRQATPDENSGLVGWLFIDLDAWASIDHRVSDDGQVIVGYDTRFAQVTLELALGELATGMAPNSLWRHTSRPSGEGTFSFVVVDDVEPTTAAFETWLVSARWRADGVGRADAVLTGGDVRLTLFASECWGPDFRRTYLLSNIPDPEFFPVGTLAGCAPELREPDFPE